jgi:hypothetical protein
VAINPSGWRSLVLHIKYTGMYGACESLKTLYLVLQKNVVEKNQETTTGHFGKLDVAPYILQVMTKSFASTTAHLQVISS